jgi:hypothetical protein
MKLVHGWRQAHRWRSVQASGTGVILSAAATAAATASSAGTLAGAIPVWAVCGLFCLIFLAALIGRLVLQKPHSLRPKRDEWDEYGA